MAQASFSTSFRSHLLPGAYAPRRNGAAEPPLRLLRFTLRVQPGARAKNDPFLRSNRLTLLIESLKCRVLNEDFLTYIYTAACFLGILTSDWFLVGAVRAGDLRIQNE